MSKRGPSKDPLPLEITKRIFGAKILVLTKTFEHLFLWVIVTLWAYLGYLLIFDGISFTIFLIFTPAIVYICELILFKSIRIRYQKIVDHSNIRVILEKAAERIGLLQIPELWLYENENAFLMSMSNIESTAIIISSRTIFRLDKTTSLSEEDALVFTIDCETLLAFQMLKLELKKPKRDVMINVILSLPIWVVFVTLLIPLAILLFIMNPFFPLAAYLGLTLFVLLTRNAFWIYDTSAEKICQLYKIHPLIAEMEIQEYRQLSVLEKNQILELAKNEEQKRRNERTAWLAIIGAGLSGALVLSLSWIPQLDFLLSYLIFLAPTLVFLSIFLLGNHREFQIMAEYDNRYSEMSEEIWVD